MFIDYSSTFGKAIKKARKERHMTQQQLADATHVSQRYLAKIENGKTHPSIDIVCIIVKALNLSMDNILHEGQLDESEHFLKELQVRLPGFTKEQKDYLITTILVFEEQNRNRES